MADTLWAQTAELITLLEEGKATIGDVEALAERLGAECAPRFHPAHVVVPYAGLAPVGWVEEVLRADRLQPELVDVSEPGAYRKLLAKLWEHEEDVVIVEHDILPWPGAVAALWECPEPWCWNAYMLRGQVRCDLPAFGCVKLTATLMAMVGDLWDIDNINTATWEMLDTHLRIVAEEKGITAHLHQPPVVHLSPQHMWSPVTDGGWAMVGAAVKLLGLGQ
jgi:hypothetical protein